MSRIMHVVAKPFKSQLRRFRKGDEVFEPLTPEEARELAPLDFAHLVARGFVVAPGVSAPSLPSVKRQR